MRRNRKDNTEKDGCIKSILNNVSFGRIETGMFYKRHFSYSSTCSGVTSLILIAWFVFIAMTAFQEVFSKNYIDSTVDQGGFDFSMDFGGASTIESYLVGLDT